MTSRRLLLHLLLNLKSLPSVHRLLVVTELIGAAVALLAALKVAQPGLLPGVYHPVAVEIVP